MSLEIEPLRLYATLFTRSAGQFLLIAGLIFTVHIRGHCQDTLSWNNIAPRVLKQAPLLAKSNSRIQHARAMKQLHFGSYLPDISLSFSSSRNEQGPRQVYLGAQPYSQPGQIYPYHSTGAHLSYSLLKWGNRQRRAEMLREKYLGEKYNRQITQQEILMTAFSVYCDLLKAQELLALVTEEKANMDQQRELVKRLVERGLQPSIDLVHIRIEVRDIQMAMERYQEAKKRNRYTLCVMMNAQDSSAIRFAPVNPRQETLLLNAGNLEGVLAKNPVIEYHKASLNVARLETDIIRWEFLPEIHLIASYQRANTRFNEVYGSLPQNWNAVLSLQVTFPLYGQNSQRIRLESQIVQEHTVRNDLRNQQRQVEIQLHDLREKISMLTNMYRLEKQNISDYRKIYKFEENEYLSGTSDYQEYIAALRTYLNANLRIVETKYQLVKTNFQIRLLRGDWDDSEHLHTRY